MVPALNALRATSFPAVLLKMLLSTLFGTVIGLERSSKNRPAGFRTHILVCLGASVAALTALYIYLDLRLPSDISRICGQVISGLGFIGAGTIIITRKMTVKGLTTAAGLWTSGIIGVAVGSGYYELGLLGTVLVLVVETWFGKLGSGIQHCPEYTVELLYNDKTSLDQVLRFCKDSRMAIVNLKIHALEDGADANYAAEVFLRGVVERDILLDRVRQMPGIVLAIGL